MNFIRHFSLVILLSLVGNCLQAQVRMPRPYNEDSLRTVLESKLHDSVRINLLLRLAGSYFFKQPDTSLFYASQALEIARSSKSESDILNCISRAGEAMRQSGDLTGAMKKQLEALELSQKVGDELMEANSYGFVGMTYLDLDSYDNAIYNLKRAIDQREMLRGDGTDFVFMIYIARAYSETNKMDSAFYFLTEAKKVLRRSNRPNFPALLANTLGDGFLLANNLDSANIYYKQALKTALKLKNFIPNHVSWASTGLGNVFMKNNMVDSGFYFARYAYAIVRKTKLNPRILDASSLLASLHRKTGKLDSALYYQDLEKAINDGIYGKDKFNELQLLLLQEQRRNQETLRSEERSKSNLQLIGLVSITGVILVASILLFRNNRIKQKTNLALQQTLKELRSTQSQLVQSEKMASLGELTAGIAHEIQNPLNFVNNFSEVSNELMGEMMNELRSNNIEEATNIATGIRQNLEKIRHHGKRADGIVKSMLQHSRSSSGQAEPTDINALCAEYIRLSYHGYRAKDKSFSAKVNTDFDPTIPMVNVVPQDIGRVILNLINNAFHAVGEKSKENVDGYEPMVTMSTKKLKGVVEIRLHDNGSGIPDAIKEKIFQPFFTTKPTGQGTGLGLSLSYDIIKAHGGTLQVNSKEGEGSEFVIQLPA